MGQWKTLKLEHVGQSWTGTWELTVGMVNVSSAYGSATRPAGPHPEATAADMLRELVDEWRAKSRRRM